MKKLIVLALLFSAQVLGQPMPEAEKAKGLACIKKAVLPAYRRCVQVERCSKKEDVEGCKKGCMDGDGNIAFVACMRGERF